jgi:transcriptional regulator with XRE-family HTH domain
MALFKNNLKQKRMHKMLTQTDLARLAGFQPCLISHYENGRRNPGIKNLLKLAEALGCTTDELIRDESRTLGSD